MDDTTLDMSKERLAQILAEGKARAEQDRAERLAAMQPKSTAELTPEEVELLGEEKNKAGSV